MSLRGLRGSSETPGDAVIPTAMTTRREIGVQRAAPAREVAVTIGSLASLCHGKDKIFIFYLNIYTYK